jgi:hypothetical protein
MVLPSIFIPLIFLAAFFVAMILLGVAHERKNSVMTKVWGAILTVLLLLFLMSFFVVFYLPVIRF